MEKVELVEQYGPQFGVNLALAALNLSKGTWHYRRHAGSYAEKYAHLKDALLQIAQDHPDYGYRKVTSELRERGGTVNHKVVQRLQKEWDLPILRRVRAPRQSSIRKAIGQLGDRINLVRGLNSIRILQVLYTDFTELRFDRGRRKAYLMPIIDHTSKLAVGWAVGLSANTELALEAWDRTRQRLLRLGIELTEVIVHHDQDPVYTGHEWLRQLCVRDRVHISYSLDGARQNTYMESFNGHFKTENVSILWEQKTMAGLIRVVESRMYYYNHIRRHASLGNLSPANFLRNNGIEP